MEKNYFFKFTLFLKFQIFLLSRRVLFLIAKKTGFQNSDFLVINKDEHFANSLVEIEFYFSKLLYVKLPQVGRKYYNGKVILNAEKLNFPYKIKVFVYGQKKKIFTIENFEAINNFHSEKFTITDFKSFYIKLNYPQILNLPRHKIINNSPNEKIEPNILAKKITLKESIKNNKIKLQPFNTEDLI